MTTRLSLKPWQSLSAAEQAAVLALTITEEQIEYAGTVERSVQVCSADSGGEITTQTLIALRAWVAIEWPQTRQLALAVDEINVAGRRAYEKAGFLDTGRKAQGRIGWDLYLTCQVGG